jgi:predicted ATPase
MLTTLAINNYRSIRELVIPLTRLNLIVGANGSGKSNLYRALRLLASTAQDGIVAPLALEGGLKSVVWAGPEDLSGRMRRGEIPVQRRAKGTPPPRLRLGFSGEDFGYAVSMGLVSHDAGEDRKTPSSFALDPEFKRESIWAGPFLRRSNLLIDREGSLVRRKSDEGWEVLTQSLPRYESLFSQVSKDRLSPEVFAVREAMRSWRFYDHFRIDHDAPARRPQIGTRTLVMHHDGRDLAAAWQTIREIGDRDALDEAVSDAFPGAHVEIGAQPGGLFSLLFHQEGLLRPLNAAELSDGTLRYLLLATALLTARPPDLMVLNEPEASLHPDLTPALGRLVRRAARHSQVWVISHSTRLAAALEEDPDCNALVLDKIFSETTLAGQGLLDKPAWHWADASK